MVLNVTATQPKTAGNLDRLPRRGGRPSTSNLNFSAGETVPNLVIAPVGATARSTCTTVGRHHPYRGRRVRLVRLRRPRRWRFGPADAGSGSRYPDGRVLEGPVAIGSDGEPVGVGPRWGTRLGGGGGGLNVTVTQPKTAGNLIVYPDLVARPGTSNLNFTAGETVPNLVIAPVGATARSTCTTSRAAPSRSWPTCPAGSRPSEKRRPSRPTSCERCRACSERSRGRCRSRSPCRSPHDQIHVAD